MSRESVKPADHLLPVATRDAQLDTASAHADQATARRASFAMIRAEHGGQDSPRATADISERDIAGRASTAAIKAMHGAGATADTASERDAAPLSGRPLSQLGADERQVVADQALSGASGSVPYQSEMEQQFGRSFSDVRVADTASARATLGAANAEGVARDNAIAFRDEAPSRATVAHELAHVVQADGASSGSSQLAEREAHSVEHQLEMGAVHATPGIGSAGVAHFKDCDGDGSHDVPKSRWRTPDDEKEVQWWTAPTKIADPFQGDTFVLDPGMDCPAPPNSEWEKPAGRIRRDEAPKWEDPFADPEACGKDPPVLMNHHLSIERQRKWEVYRDVALGVQGSLMDMKPDVDLYQHAEKDGDLKALGVILPKKGWTGDMASLIAQQEVPKRGGPEVRDVAWGQSESDQKGIEKAAGAMESGKGGIEGKFNKSNQADEAVMAAVDLVKGAAADVAATVEFVNAAAAEVEVLRAEDEADAASAEIAALKEEARKAKEVLAFFTSLPEKIAGVAEKGIDPLAAIGTVGSFLIDMIPDPRMEAAEAKLAAAKKKMHDKKAEAAQARLEGAKKKALKAVHELSATKHTLREKLGARRDAYNAAGTAAGAAAGTKHQPNDRIAAMIAAIPLVEMMVARLRTIKGKADAAVPAYSSDAGIGFGIALHHQNWAAWDLPRALGLISQLQFEFAWTLADWESNLASLKGVMEQIGGARPGGDSA